MVYPRKHRNLWVQDIYQFDQSLREKGFKMIAGIDEAGRGPLAGPVVAAAVILPSHKKFNGLRDSKKVPEKERESIFWDLICDSIDIGIGVVDHDLIDRINIRNATILAMKKAIMDLQYMPDLLLIDAMNIPDIKIEQISLIRGESKSASIAAASIVAKVTRDKLMYNYDLQYPEYGFGKHKGYATKEHIEKIIAHGPCKIHRKSFERVNSYSLFVHNTKGQVV